MGAAAINKYLIEFPDHRNKIKGLLLEGCYISLDDAIHNRFQLLHAPFICYSFLKFWSKLLLNLNFNSMEIYNFAAMIKQPLIFLAGEKDYKTGYEKMKILYLYYPNKYKFVSFPNAHHTNVFESDKPKYISETIDFINKF